MESISDINLSASMTQKIKVTEIVADYGSKLKGFIRKRVRNIEDAEDILQDVYYQLSEADKLMKPVDNVIAWLFTVARNRITDLYRKNKPLAFSEISDNENVLYELTNLLLENDDSPEKEYLNTLIWKEFEKALNELPKKQRYVFEMNEIRGIPFKELAKQSGETVNTLISRKHYAVLYLRERLQILYNELINF